MLCYVHGNQYKQAVSQKYMVKQDFSVIISVKGLSKYLQFNPPL